MKADVSCENLLIVTQDESKVHFGYKDGRVIILVFNSVEAADKFYRENEFLNEDAYRFRKTISGINLRSVYVGEANGHQSL
jgi:uncharacterized protein (DUF1330 family)